MSSGGRKGGKARRGPHTKHLNFTGKSGSDSKKKRQTTRKQRRLNRGTHVNKYEDMQ